MIDENKKTLLLVEDEAIIAIHQKITLEKYGYSVIAVNSGEEALEVFLLNPQIDLILMDIDLGDGIDGTETAKIMLKTRELPIVFLSSHTSLDVVGKTEMITSYGYVVKSSGPTVLDASIKMAFKLFDANEKTEKERELLKTTLNSIGDAVISTNNEGIITSINPVAEKLTGWSGAEAIGKSICDIFKIYNTLTREPIDNPVKKVLETSTIVGLANHTMLISKDKREYQISDSGAPIKSNNGKIAGVVLVFRNVSEEYRIEKALQDIIDNNPISIQILDLNGFTLHVNSSFIKLFGDKPPADYSIFDDALIMKQGFGNLMNELRQGAVVHFPEFYHNPHELFSFMKDRPVWISILGFPIRDTNGKIEQYVLMHTDVSEQRQADKILGEIITNNPMSIQIVDKEGYTLSINTAHTKLFGALPPSDYTIFNDKQLIEQGISGLFDRVKTGEIIHFPDVHYNVHELISDCPDKPLWVRMLAFPLLDNKGNPDRFVFMHQDVTEQKNMEQNIFESEQKYRLLTEFSSDVIWVLNLNKNKFTFISPVITQLRGLTVEEAMAETLEDSLTQESLSDVREAISFYTKEFFENPKKTITYITEVQQPCKDGSKIWVEISCKMRVNELNEIEIVGASRSIEKRKKTEQALSLSEEKFSKSFQLSSNLMAISTAKDDILIEVNDGFLERFEYTRNEIIGKTTRELNLYEDYNERDRLEALMKKNGSIKNIEVRGKSKSGKLLVAILSVSYLKIGDENCLLTIMTDITKQKLSEERIQLLLSEKELILKEVHHRIKNNMSTINSILNLQASTLEDPKAIEALEDAANRVQSMMVLYTKLYQSVDFNTIAVDQYIPSLVDEIIENFPNAKSVTVVKNIDHFMLDVKRLQPLGIIINELLTNSMKYAFQGKKEGLITVSATLKGNRVTVIVADNGIGMSESMVFENSKGFGLMLVSGLTKQLKATMQIVHDNGTKIILEFQIQE